MHRHDEVLVYHAGTERRIVGIARVIRAAYVEPGGGDVVDLVGVAPLAHPVPRADLARLPRLANWELVRVPRLTVLPVPNVAWRAVMSLSIRDPRRNRVS
jgi:predicted RNA-binding protein with PUA-like domain